MIGEVAKLCNVKAHVLRYWEGQFPQLNPSKRRGRRYYQREDVLLILEIHDLLHRQCFTVEGAIAQLSDKKRKPSESDRLKGSEVLSNQQDITQSSAIIATNIDIIGLAESLGDLIQNCQKFQNKVRNEL